MISQNALHHAEKCRFCWMCRHLCPVQHQTGKELNTPRAKGLLISMVEKGTQAFDRDMAKAMYECLLCDACTNDCMTGYQPPLFIREARREAVVEDLAPEEVMTLLDNALTCGNIFGKEKPSFAKEGKDVLVYIGDAAAFYAPEMAKNFLALLEKAGVSAHVLDSEPSSGFMLADLIGYTEEVTAQAKKCASAMEEKGLPVVVLDSYDLEIMKQKYPEWGFEISLDMMTATSFVAKLIEEGKIAKKAALNIKGAPHDDDRLARVFHEFEPIRKMAEAAGFEKGEMFLKEKLAKSCGTLVAYSYMPEITLRVAGGRWEDLLRTDCEAMLTANPQAYFLFEKTLPEGKKLVDLYGALL